MKTCPIHCTHQLHVVIASATYSQYNTICQSVSTTKILYKLFWVWEWKVQNMATFT